MILLDFPTRSADEQADDVLLDDVFARQQQLDDLEVGMAALLYKARALYIGGMCLPWSMLTKGQQQGYRMEAKRLIQGGSL